VKHTVILLLLALQLLSACTSPQTKAPQDTRCIASNADLTKCRALLEFYAFPLDVRIDTRRFYIRPLAPRDIKSFYSFQTDPRITATLGGKFTKKEIEKTTEKSIIRHPDGDTWLTIEFGIFSKTRDEFVGNIQLTRLNDRELVKHLGLSTTQLREKSRATIGYGIVYDQWGNGIATEAIEAIINFCFKNLGLTHIYASTVDSNIPSQRVLEKNGFVKVGSNIDDIDGEPYTAIHFELKK